jgi:hypothetical protein
MIAVRGFAFIYYLRSGGAKRRHRALSAPTSRLNLAGVAQRNRRSVRGACSVVLFLPEEVSLGSLHKVTAKG